MNILSDIRRTGHLGEKRQEVLDLLALDARVTRCVVIYAIGSLNENQPILVSALEDRLSKAFPGGYEEAFIKIALLKQSLVGKSDVDKLNTFEHLAEGAPPELLVETLKEILRLDQERGKRILDRLADDRSFPLILELYRIRMLLSDPKKACRWRGNSGEEYDMLVALIDGTVLLTDKGYTWLSDLPKVSSTAATPEAPKSDVPQKTNQKRRGKE